MLGFVDRQILAIMVVPIQRDLALTDVHLSLLQGFAFALFFSTAGLVAGWAIDRFSRRLVCMTSLFTWSICTALCGVSTGFWSLFAARVGVGVGESTMTPGGYSLISDLFPKRQLSLALGIYTMGANLGVALSYIGGGAIAAALATRGSLDVPLLGEVRSWQVTFLILGLAGVLLAPMFVTIKEPQRRGQMSEGKGLMGPALKFLRQKPRLFASHFIGFSCNNAIGFVVLAWSPAFLARKFGWTEGHIGLAVGLTVGIAGMSGPLIAGTIVGRLQKFGMRDLHFAVPIFSAIVVALLAGLSMLAPTPWLWLVCLAGIYFITSATLTYGSTALQLVTPNEFRGRMVAIFLAVSAVLGSGLGPLVVALITEHVLHDHNAVGISIGLVVLGFALMESLVLHWGLPSYRRALDETSKLWAN